MLIASHLCYLIKYLVVFMIVVHTYFYNVGSLCLFSNGAKLRILYYNQFLDKRSGIQKDCWF